MPLLCCSTSNPYFLVDQHRHPAHCNTNAGSLQIKMPKLIHFWFFRWNDLLWAWEKTKAAWIGFSQSSWNKKWGVPDYMEGIWHVCVVFRSFMRTCALAFAHFTDYFVCELAGHISLSSRLGQYRKGLKSISTMKQLALLCWAVRLEVLNSAIVQDMKEE